MTSPLITERAKAGMRLFLVIAVVLALTIAPAFATDFAAIGGSGDHQTVDQCPDGMYLVGLKGRTGVWVDQVQIVCAPVVPLIYGTGWLPNPESAATNTKWFGPERGGASGAPAESVCPADAYVIAAGITLTSGKQVLQAFLACAGIDGQATTQVQFRGSGAAAGSVNLNTNYCPTGEVARGFTIHYGEAVNAMGLICGNVTLASSAQTASATLPASTASTTSSSFQVHGAIGEKWQSLGGAGGPLGAPTTNEMGTPDGIGRYNHFVKGAIYWTPDTGAHEVHGGIADKWASMGWEKSSLGYPTSDETGTADGLGRYNRFQHGAIYWTQKTGAHEMHGAIAAKWEEMGGEKSPLGYPTSDEVQDGAYRRTDFEHGFIRWSQDTGVVVTTTQ